MTEDRLGPFEVNDIYNINNVDGLKQLPDKCIDLIFTDGVNHPTASFPWLEQLDRALKPGGQIYQPSSTPQKLDNTTGVSYADYSAQGWTEMYAYFGFRGIDRVVCHDRGSPNPSSHYIWLIFVREKDTFHLSDRAIFISCPSRFDLSDEIKGMGRPPAEYFWMIRQSSKVGDIILDIHAGSASCGVMALSMGRKYIGFENNDFGPGIYETGKRNLDAAKKILSEGGEAVKISDLL